MPTKRRNLAAVNDTAAVRWAGPFGWAVLQVLRRSDEFAEADFAAFMEKAPVPPGEPDLRQVTLSAEHPEGSPDFVGDYVSKVGAGQVLEPAPPAAFYKRVTPR